MAKNLLIGALGVAVLYYWLTRKKQPAKVPVVVGGNADASYSRYGNHAPTTVGASSMVSASGIGTSDYRTLDTGSPFVLKSTHGFVYPNKPMVDDTNSAAGYETLPYVDPFHDESGN